MTPDAAVEIIQRATAAQQRGDFAAADSAFRQALAISADDTRALGGLGVLCYQTGRHSEAIERLTRAIAVGGPAAHLFVNLGLAQHASGAYNDAVASHREAIRLRPDFALARNSLGVSLLALESRDEALAAFKQAIALDPQHARAHFNLGTVQRQSGDLAGATRSFRRACELIPNFAQGLASLAGTLQDHGDWDGALENYRLAQRSDPNDIVVLNNLAQLLIKREQPAEAIALLERAIALSPQNALILASLGACLAAESRHEAAVEVLKKAIALDPRSKDAWFTLANTLAAQEKWVEAVTSYETAILNGWSPADGCLHIAAIMADHDQNGSARALMEAAIRAEPENGKVQYRWGMIHLKRGELATGWDMYEKRFYDQASDFRTFKKRPPAPPPYWEGENLTGKSILVWREQGLGDEIMGASMIPDLMARARRCLLVCNARLAGIYSRSFPGLETADFAKMTDFAASGADFQIPLLSLGRFFRRDFAAIPKRAGYLKANPDKVAVLRDKYVRLSGGRKIVGVSWASRNDQVGNAKTGDIADWGPVLQTPNTWFVNLQYGDCRRALDVVRERTGVEIFQDASVDPMGPLDDYFAQLAALDLLISTSNTGVHAAGALNVPTWVLLPHGRGSLWHWFQGREDSPWYGSVHLFRQPADASRDQPWWCDPVARAGAALARLGQAQ